MVIDDRIRLIELFDTYGALLTERQQRIFLLHYADDLSFGEIAEELAVSRPAVADHLNRASTFLFDCEKRLGLSVKLQVIKSGLSEAIETLVKCGNAEGVQRSENLDQTLKLLKDLSDTLSG